MSANIHLDRLSNQYAFYARKQKAWHGLGQVIEEAVNAYQAMKLAHLDYIVDVTDAYIKIDTGSEFLERVVPGTRATYRKDTNAVFGAVGSRYEVVQNGAFLNFIYDVFKSPEIFHVKDITLETAGALGRGEKVFVTAKLPGTVKLRSTGDDIAETYILVTSTHDGSGLFTAGLTNIRVVCNNTLNAALPGLTNKVQFKHTKNIHDNIAQAAKLMNLTQKWNEQQQQAYDAMCKIQISEEDIIKYIGSLMLSKDQQASLQEAKYQIAKMTDEQLSTKMRNKLFEALNWIDKGAGQEEESIRGSVYWVYQGYNGYLNNGIVYDSQEEKFNNLTDGRALKLNQQAFDTALAMI